MGWSNCIRTIGRGVFKGAEEGTKAASGLAKGVGEGLGATARGLGGWKGVVATGGVVGAVQSEEGLAGLAGDVIFGKDGAENIKQHGIAGEAIDIAIGEDGKEAVKQVKDTISEVVDSGKEAVKQAKEAWNGATSDAGIDNTADPYQGYAQQDGLSAFIRGTTTNPLGMGGNFLSNLASGNVSTLSMAAMIASSFMVFGRFGLLTKALGALLGMHTIGRNSQPVYQQRAVRQAQTAQQTYQPSTSQASQTQAQAQPLPQVEDTEVMDRPRGRGR